MKDVKVHYISIFNVSFLQGTGKFSSKPLPATDRSCFRSVRKCLSCKQSVNDGHWTVGIWRFPARHGGTPIAGWFISWKIPLQKMDDLGDNPIWKPPFVDQKWRFSQQRWWCNGLKMLVFCSQDQADFLNELGHGFHSCDRGQVH